ncbi:unnamed protein product, partial [Ascophyllum nodosum]
EQQQHSVTDGGGLSALLERSFIGMCEGCKHGARLGTGWFAPLLFAPLPGAPG